MILYTFRTGDVYAMYTRSAPSAPNPVPEMYTEWHVYRIREISQIGGGENADPIYDLAHPNLQRRENLILALQTVILAITKTKIIQKSWNFTKKHGFQVILMKI